MGSWNGMSFCSELLGKYAVLRKARQGQVNVRSVEKGKHRND